MFKVLKQPQIEVAAELIVRCAGAGFIGIQTRPSDDEPIAKFFNPLFQQFPLSLPLAKVSINTVKEKMEEIAAHLNAAHKITIEGETTKC